MSDERPIWLHVPHDAPDGTAERLMSFDRAWGSTALLLQAAARWHRKTTGNLCISEGEYETLIERFLEGDKGHAFHRHDAPPEEQVN